MITVTVAVVLDVAVRVVAGPLTVSTLAGPLTVMVLLCVRTLAGPLTVTVLLAPVVTVLAGPFRPGVKFGMTPGVLVNAAAAGASFDATTVGFDVLVASADDIGDAAEAEVVGAVLAAIRVPLSVETGTIGTSVADPP